MSLSPKELFDAEQTHDVLGRLPVAVAHDAVVELTGFALGITTTYEAVTHHAALAAVAGGTPREIGDFRARLFLGRDSDEIEVDVTRGELPPGVRAAGVDQHREGLLHRFRQQEAATDVVVLAIEIEILLGPGTLDARQPFVGHAVALVVLALDDAEHLDFGAKPTTDDVQAEAPGRDVVDGGRLLGGVEGVYGRHVRGREDHDAFGVAGHRRRPREHFEVVGVEPRAAAEVLPASDGHQQFETGPIRGLRDRDVVRIGRPKLVGACVMVQPFEQFWPNTPSLSLLSLKAGTCCRRQAWMSSGCIDNRSVVTLWSPLGAQSVGAFRSSCHGAVEIRQVGTIQDSHEIGHEIGHEIDWRGTALSIFPGSASAPAGHAPPGHAVYVPVVWCRALRRTALTSVPTDARPPRSKTIRR